LYYIILYYIIGQSCLISKKGVSLVWLVMVILEDLFCIY